MAAFCRKHRVLNATFYNWRTTLGGMDVSEAQRFEPLVQENS